MREATGRHHRESQAGSPSAGPAGDGGSSAGQQKEKEGWGRSLKVGGAAVLGGAALFATGGLATPLVMGVLGVVGAGGALTAVSSQTICCCLCYCGPILEQLSCGYRSAGPSSSLPSSVPLVRASVDTR